MRGGECVIKTYLKRRELLQEQFERLMEELEDGRYLKEEEKALIDSALNIDGRLHMSYLVVVIIGIVVLWFAWLKRKKNSVAVY